jgi:uncharacterized protein YjdB
MAIENGANRRNWKRPGFAHDAIERLALDKLHGEIMQMVDLTHRVNRYDVRVRESGDRPRFALEAFDHAGAREQSRRHQLHRHVAVEREFASQEDRSHSAAADLAKDLELAGGSLPQATDDALPAVRVRGVRHSKALIGRSRCSSVVATMKLQRTGNPRQGVGKLRLADDARERHPRNPCAGDVRSDGWLGKEGRLMSMRRWLPAALVVGLAVLLNSCGSSTDAPSDVALVSLDLASTTLLVANTVTITATVQGKLGSVSDAVSWHSDAPNIADVSSTGLQTARVTAKSQGTTRITASAGGQSASATITVTNIPVSSVSIASRVDTVMVGTTKQLTAVAYDGSGGALTGRPIQWSSLNTSIATVDGTGTVTPLTLGVVKIVATSETKSDTAQVTVTPGAVTQITISPPSLSLYEGDTASFQVVLKDVANDVLSGRAVTWTSSDPTVAAVASSAANTAIGNIRGVAKGGPITVTATSEGKSTTGTVQVRIVPAKSVSMVPASLTLFVGGRGLVTATALDSSGNALPLRAIHWASGDTTIATVAAAGSTATLTGVKAGTASVTATTDEGTTGTTLVTVQNAVTHVLTVTLGFNEITSGGSVTSNPPGINCALAHTVSSGTCSSSFAAGTSGRVLG